MKIEERTEMRPVVIKTYTAKDGKQFDTYDECYRYELDLELRAKQAREEKAFEKTIYWWSCEYSGLGGYLDCGDGTIYLIDIDETVLEWSKDMSFDEPLEGHLGERAFLRCDGDGEWYYEGSIDDVIEHMKKDLRSLKFWKEA